MKVDEKILEELTLIRKELQAIRKCLEPEEPPYVTRWINGKCGRGPRKADPKRKSIASDTSAQCRD